MGLADQLSSDDVTEKARSAASLAPGSTPSTWAGAIVLVSVVGLALMRRSFRRML